MHENRWEQVQEVLEQFPECQQSMQVGIASVAHVGYTECCHFLCKHACLNDCASSHVRCCILIMLHAQSVCRFAMHIFYSSVKQCQVTKETDPLAA